MLTYVVSCFFCSSKPRNSPLPWAPKLTCAQAGFYKLISEIGDLIDKADAAKVSWYTPGLRNDVVTMRYANSVENALRQRSSKQV